MAAARGWTFRGSPSSAGDEPVPAPRDMANVLEQVRSTGNMQSLLTEPGRYFGCHDLVADRRGLPFVRDLARPV